MTTQYAFPMGNPEQGGYDGMTLRDYFAAHCPQDWIDKFIPTTIGDTIDAMIARRIIPADRNKVSPLKAYNDQDCMKLIAALRYEYADYMMAHRDQC